MGEFFGSMYCVFEDLFGLELADYLWGNSSPISINNQFIAIGFWMLGIALSIAIVYYYVVNHPRLCNWWGWSIFAVLTLVINFIGLNFAIEPNAITRPNGIAAKRVHIKT